MLDLSDKYYKSKVSLITLKGKDSLFYLQELTSNNITNLQPNFVKITLLLNESGGLIDVLYVFNYDNQENKIIIAYSHNEEKVVRYLEKNINNKDIVISKMTENYYKVLLLSYNTYSLCTDLGLKIPVADKFTHNENCISFYDEINESVCILIPESKMTEFNSKAKKYIELNTNDFNYYRITRRIPQHPYEINESIKPESCNLDIYLNRKTINTNEEENDIILRNEMHCFSSYSELNPEDLIYNNDNNCGFISSVSIKDNIHYCLAFISPFDIKIKDKYYTKIKSEKNFLNFII